MAAPIVGLIARGYTAHTLLNHLVRQFPQHAGKIEGLYAMGYTADHILRSVSHDNQSDPNDYLTENEKHQKNIKNQRRNALLGIGGAVATVGAIAGGASALMQRNRPPPIPTVQPSAILPAQQPIAGQLPYNPTVLRGQRGRQPSPSPGPIVTPYQQPRIGQNQKQQLQLGYNPPAPQGPRGRPPAPSQGPIAPPYKHNPQTNVALVKNLKEDQRIGQALASGLSLPAIAQALRTQLPKFKLALLDRAPGGFEQVLEDYEMVMQEQNALQRFKEHQKGLQTTQQPQQPQSLVQQEQQRFQEQYPEANQIPEDDSQLEFDFEQQQAQENQQPQVQQMQQLPQKQHIPPQTFPEMKQPEINEEEVGYRVVPGIEMSRKEKLDDYLEFLTEKDHKFAEEKFKELSEREKELSKEIQEIKKGGYPEYNLEKHKELRKSDQDALIAIKIHLGKTLSDQEKEILSSMEEPKKLQVVIKPEVIEIANTIVMTPVGAGEIKHDGKAGKIVKTEKGEKSFKHEDIEEVPEDVIQAVSAILDIPEVDRSSNIALFLYNPADKEMYFQFHDGTAYKYYDIDPEKVFRLAKKMHIPVSSGENIFGAWSPEDKKSLGASFYQEILKDPKYRKPRKGEPPNPYYRKMETMYDYWEKLRKKPYVKKKKE